MLRFRFVTRAVLERHRCAFLSYRCAVLAPHRDPFAAHPCFPSGSRAGQEAGRGRGRRDGQRDIPFCLSSGSAAALEALVVLGGLLPAAIAHKLNGQMSVGGRF